MGTPFQKTSLMLIIAILLLAGCASVPDEAAYKEPFTIGTIADCQYKNVVKEGVRKYHLSDKKLKACVDHLNTMDLEFVIHLGDFIDEDFESFDVVGPIYDQLKAPAYHALGNHDYDVAEEMKKSVPDKLHMPGRYYDFKFHGWRFVVLDGNDMSFYAHAKGSPEYEKVEAYYTARKLDAPKWNGAVSEEQLAWLKGTLERASRAGENVMLFCHFPVYPPDVHNLWNAEEVVALIESYPCVQAYINGHNHAGDYDLKNGIHYLTIRGMVDTEETSYAVIQIHPDWMKISGFGREPDRLLYFVRAQEGK